MIENDFVNRSIAGTLAASGESDPFMAIPDTPIYLTLTGTWVGTVTVESSFDGTTWAPLTVAGESWAVFTGNCNEAIDEPQRSGILYRVDFERSSGTLIYRLGH